MTTSDSAGSGSPPTQEIPAVGKVAVRPKTPKDPPSPATRDAAPSGPRPAGQAPGQNNAASGPAGSPVGSPTAPAVASAAPAVASATPGGSARPVAPPRPRPARPAASSGRRIRLTVSRIDPWSALKMSFLLSVALGIALVVAVGVLWLILDGMGAFTAVNNLIGKIVVDNGERLDILDFIGFKRVLSLSIVVAVVDVFLWTAVATLGAFIYNVSSSLVGGLQLTLTDD